MRVRTLVLWALLAVPLGCGDDETPVESSAPAVPATPKPAPQPRAAALDAGTTPADDLVVRRFRPARDPFRSVTEVRRRASAALIHPLQQYSVQQLQLLGIIWGIADPKALLKAPDGREYVIGVGTPVGTGDGKVVAILQDRVVIVERYYDYRGQLQTERYEIVLPSQGE